MKVLRLHGTGDLRLQDEPEPSPGPGEALVRVRAVGVCGSDLHWFEEAGIGDAQLKRPLVLGHEFAGQVVSADSRLYGRSVAVDPAIPCMECEFCVEGSPNLCENLRFAGHGEQDGGLQELIAWPERCLFPLPDGLSDAEGALLEPLGVALYAVELAGLQPGMGVGVFGCGPIGLLIVQLARLSGARQILATDRLPHRVEAARSLGATDAFLVDESWQDEVVWRASDERGVAIAFEVAGENQAVQTAISAARPGGKVMLVGIPYPDVTTFTASAARRKGLTLQLVRRMKFTYPRAIQLVEQRQVDLRALATQFFPLERGREAFNAAQRREGLKVIVEL